MSIKFVEITTGDPKHQPVPTATSAIKMAKGDGPNKSVIVPHDKTEIVVPGVPYDEMKKTVVPGNP